MLYSSKAIEDLVAKAEKASEADPVPDAAASYAVSFVVGHRGMDKTRVFRKMSSHGVSDGSRKGEVKQRIRRAGSSIEGCLEDAIVVYIRHNNSLVTRSHFLTVLEQHDGKLHVPRLAFFMRRKIREDEIRNALRAMAPLELWELYQEVANNIPLSLFVIKPTISEEDKNFLLKLSEHTFVNGLSLFIATRPYADNLRKIQKVLGQKEGCRVAPLLPRVQKDASNGESHGQRIVVSIDGVDACGSVDSLADAMSAYDCYFELLGAPRRIVNELDNPAYLFLLGRQEITIRSSKDLALFWRQADKKPILSIASQGSILLVDSLAYYLTLSQFDEEVHQRTQTFFLSTFLTCGNDDKNRRNSRLRFLSEAGVEHPCVLARRFPEYFSDFAVTTRLLVKDSKKGVNSAVDYYQETEKLIGCVCEYSEQLLKVLSLVYHTSGVLWILDFGLERIECALLDQQRKRTEGELSKAELSEVELRFIELCVFEAYRWLDTTLADKLLRVAEAALLCGIPVSLLPSDMRDASKECIIDHFNQGLRKLHMSIVDDGLIGQATVFLSYCHKDNDVANAIDEKLSELGYLVRRDCRDVVRWGQLREYMMSIRNQDYVIPILSDSYLHSENCFFELTWLVGDDTFADRTFPIAIEFPEDKGKSIFGFDYRIEIVKYWQDQAKEYENQLKGIDPENIAGLAVKYRDIKYMAQSADVFLQEFLGNRLIGTLSGEDPNAPEKAKELVCEIDRRILGV